MPGMCGLALYEQNRRIKRVAGYCAQIFQKTYPLCHLFVAAALGCLRKVTVHRRREEVRSRPPRGRGRWPFLNQRAMQNEQMIKPSVRLKPLRPHRAADDRLEKDLRLLSFALRVWEARNHRPVAGIRTALS